MQELVTEFSQWPSEAGREIAHAAQIILTGKSQQIRDLCKGPWEVQRYEQKKKRPTDSIKEELKVALTKRANQLKMDETRKSNTETQYHQRDDIQHATANFCIETSMKETACCLKAIQSDFEFLVRVVDHACSSDQCVSSRIAVMCQDAQWKTVRDLYNDQPLDACGYIAADAVCRMREAALAEADSWHYLRVDPKQGLS